MSEVKIFKIGDVDWVASESAEDALELMNEHVGEENHYNIDDVYELNGEEMLIHKIHETDESDLYDDDGKPTGTFRSFREELDLRVAAGESFPAHFACSEW